MDGQVFAGMEYVYAVYQAGSFNKAAQKLFISQPSISATVRRIEERIGCKIFDRGMKPLQLTECGRRYIESVEKIYALEREFSEFVNDLEGLHTGKLVLGGSSLFSSLVLPPMVGTFRHSYPQVQIELIEETTSRLENMLEIGKVDLVVDYQIPHQENYDCLVMEEEDLMLAVPSDFPINQRLKPYQVDLKLVREKNNGSITHIPPVPLELFKDEPFILLKQGNDSRKRADMLCLEYHLNPHVVMEFDQQMSSFHASNAGIGISFVSSTLVSRISAISNLTYYRLGDRYSRRQVRLFWKRGKYLTKAMETFLNLACTQSSSPLQTDK